MSYSKKLWQHPYVNVFKHFRIDDKRKVLKEGDVSSFMDKDLKCTVYRISGAIPAGNFIQLPRNSSQSLGLNGRYLYILFKPTSLKCFVAHLEIASNDGLIVRVSFSNLFKEFKATNTWLQFPYLSANSKESPDSITSNVKISPLSSPQASKWTVLAFDLQYLLSVYLNKQYSYIKSIKVCANMSVKNIMTSDLEFDPRIKRGRGALHKTCAMPREMVFPLLNHDAWDDVYLFIKFPSDAFPTPYTTFSHKVNENQTGHKKSISNLDNKRIVCPTNKNPENEQLSDENDNCLHIYASAEDEVCIHKHSEVPIKGSAQANTEKFTTLKPNPLLRLEKAIGFGGCTFRELYWGKDFEEVIFVSYSIVVAQNIKTSRQRFFIGHTDNVSCLAVYAKGDLLATGQTGENSVTRIWQLSSNKLLTIFQSHAHSLLSLSFSSDGSLLCGVGKDRFSKSMVVFWDTSKLNNCGDVMVVAKAHTEVDISAMKICPFESCKSISFGEGNIRLWRLKNSTLRSCPIMLGEYSKSTITDIAFVPHEDKKSTNNVLLSSKEGFMFCIDVDNVVLLYVNKLESDSKIPISITCVNVAPSYCITGSSDGLVRIWSSDMSTVLIEANHDNPISRVATSNNFLKVLTSTNTGQIGILDISNKKYSSLMRSHTSQVLSLSVDPKNESIATVSEDSSLRIWNIFTGEQLYDFKSIRDAPVCVSYGIYSDSEGVFACGFQSGCVRIFTVNNTKLIAELKSHASSVRDIVWHPFKNFLYSSCESGNLALVSFVHDQFQDLRVLYNVMPLCCEPGTLAIRPDGKYLTYIGPSEYVLTFINAASFDDVLRIDISRINQKPNSSVLAKAIKVAFGKTNEMHLLVVTNAFNILVLDSTSGTFLKQISNAHTDSFSNLITSQNGRFLITCGDNSIKIWDYNMQHDINFQQYIAHVIDISCVAFTADQSFLITAIDNICLWSIATESGKSTHSIFEGDNISRETSPRDDVPTPLVVNPLSLPDPDISAIENDTSTLNGSSLNDTKMPSVSNSPMTEKHFRIQKDYSSMSQIRYLAPEDQAGLNLQAVIGINYFSTNNIIWSPVLSSFIFSSGSSIVLENLNSETSDSTILSYHSTDVSSIALLHSGKFLVSASGPTLVSNQATICVWDLDTLKMINSVNYHKGEIQKLSVSGNDKILASVGDYRDNFIALWSLNTLSLLVVSFVNYTINDLEWDPYSPEEFVSVGDHGSVNFWLLNDENSSSLQLNVHPAKIPPDLDADLHMTCLAFGLNNVLYIGTQKGIVTVWDTRNNECFLNWIADSSTIFTISTSAGRVVTASNYIRVWALASENIDELSNLPDHGLHMEDEMKLDSMVTSLCMDDNCEMGVLATLDGTIWYVNWSDCSSVRFISSHSDKITGVQSNDNFLVTSCADGSVRAWSISDQEQVIKFQVLTSQATCVSLTSGGLIIAAAGYSDGTMRLFNLNQLEMIMKWESSEYFKKIKRDLSIQCISFCTNDFILIGYRIGIILLFSVKANKTMRAFNDHKNACISQFDCIPHNTYIYWLSASNDQRISVWKANWLEDDCQMLDWISFPGMPNTQDADEILVPTLAKFSPDLQYIVYCGHSAKKCLNFYNLKSKAVTKQIPLNSWALSLDISPSGHLISIGCEDWLIKIIDFHEGTFQDFFSHTNSVTIVKFLALQKQLVSVSGSHLQQWAITV